MKDIHTQYYHKFCQNLFQLLLFKYLLNEYYFEKIINVDIKNNIITITA
jgi:hypothetical protein